MKEISLQIVSAKKNKNKSCLTSKYGMMKKKDLKKNFIISYGGGGE